MNQEDLQTIQLRRKRKRLRKEEEIRKGVFFYEAKFFKVF